MAGKKNNKAGAKKGGPQQQSQPDVEESDITGQLPTDVDTTTPTSAPDAQIDSVDGPADVPASPWDFEPPSATTTTTNQIPSLIDTDVPPSDVPLPSSAAGLSSPTQVDETATPIAKIDSMPSPASLTTPKAIVADTPASSVSPSRTATPATVAYETAASYDTPAGSRTPSPRTGNIFNPPSVRRTMVVDWPVELVSHQGKLVPFSQTFQAPGEGATPGNITCASDVDAHGNSGVKITLDMGYSALLELRVFNQMDSTAPIISLYKNVVEDPEFRMSWRALKQVLQNSPQSCVLFSLSITVASMPPPMAISSPYIPPTISETCSPAAIEALAHFLDQPGGHDVVFCFPDNKHLYADRYVLQRASRYFRQLFLARRDSLAMGPRSSIPRLAEDSDAEPSKSDDEGSGSRSRSRSPSGSASEHDITTQPILTPLTSVNGDVSHAALPLPKYTFQRTASPLMDDNIFVMNINETSFNTFRAFLYYLYTGFISFAPLTSSFQQFPESSKSSHSASLEQQRLEARNALVGDYMRKYPNRPVPVSPKSIYAVALKYELPALEAQSLSRISSAIVNPLVATSELFSAFTRVHEHIRETQLRNVIDNWDDVVKSKDWAVAREKGKAQPDAYFATVLCEILERLPPASGRI